MSAASSAPVEVATAGAVPWRRRGGRLEVALVHRIRYDDWSWPKGKVEEREGLPATAVRETWEEAGLRVLLGIPLPTSRYPIAARGGAPQEKVVRYWAARAGRSRPRLEHEVDRMRWASPKKAQGLLTYDRDRDQLAALVAADERGELGAWPLVLVRHAHAVPRKAWDQKDWVRPLDARGKAQAADLVATLGAYGVRRVASSSATRCVHTVAPYAKTAKQTVHGSSWLSEEGYDDKPSRALAITRQLLKEGDPALVCSHGPVLPALLEELIAHTGKDAARGVLREACADHMVKGEALVAHVVGRGKKARIVAAERHLPQR